jgi:hypothetical protein
MWFFESLWKSVDRNGVAVLGWEESRCYVCTVGRLGQEAGGR